MTRVKKKYGKSLGVQIFNKATIIKKNNVDIFFSSYIKTCHRYSLEMSWQGISNEYLQHYYVCMEK